MPRLECGIARRRCIEMTRARVDLGESADVQSTLQKLAYINATALCEAFYDRRLHSEPDVINGINDTAIRLHRYRICSSYLKRNQVMERSSVQS